MTDPARPVVPVIVDDVAQFAADVVNALRDLRAPIRGSTANRGDFFSFYTAEVSETIIGQLLQRRAVEETREVNAINGDPYAFEGETFAKLVAFEQRRQDDRASLMVRQRVLDDVRATHELLDAIPVRSGLPLAARVGLLFVWLLTGQKTAATFETTIDAERLFARPERRRSAAADPIAVDGAQVPDATEVLADLDQLDAVTLLGMFRGLELIDKTRPAPTSEGDVADMVNAACYRALESGKLRELAKAAREAVAHNKGEK